MTNIVFLEQIAKLITSIIIVDEKHVFDGPCLNQVARGLSNMRFHIMKTMMEVESASKANVRLLFEGFRLEDAAHETVLQWATNWTEAIARPPVAANV